jgi:hypothetical protein
MTASTAAKDRAPQRAKTNSLVNARGTADPSRQGPSSPSGEPARPLGGDGNAGWMGRTS